MRSEPGAHGTHLAEWKCFGGEHDNSQCSKSKAAQGRLGYVKWWVESGIFTNEESKERKKREMDKSISTGSVLETYEDELRIRSTLRKKTGSLLEYYIRRRASAGDVGPS